MKKILAMCLGLTFVVVMPVVHAEIQAPDELIKNAAQEVLAIVKQDREIQAGSQKKVFELVDAKVLPHFNFTRMTRLAVGKHTANRGQSADILPWRHFPNPSGRGSPR